MAEEISEDLSQAGISISEKKDVNFRILLTKQRFDQREWIFVVGLLVFGLLTCVFLFLAYTLLCLVWVGKSNVLGWPLVALSSITMISAITILVSLARSVYVGGSGKNDKESTETEGVASLISSLSGLISSISPKS